MTKYLDYNGLSYFWERIKSIFAKSSELATVATSGSYNDLTDTPTVTQDVFVCNFNGSTMDKTIQEIEDANRAGKVVICLSNYVIFYLHEFGQGGCRFRSIVNQSGRLRFDYIRYSSNTWSTGSDSWSSKANVSTTPQSIVVTDITALTAEQLNALKVGDIVIKSIDGGYNNHTYTVSYENGNLGECSLVYSSYDMIEEVSYKKVNNAWTYIETKQRIF